MPHTFAEQDISLVEVEIRGENGEESAAAVVRQDDKTVTLKLQDGREVAYPKEQLGWPTQEDIDSAVEVSERTDRKIYVADQEKVKRIVTNLALLKIGEGARHAVPGTEGQVF
jgi:hypothetical protein